MLHDTPTTHITTLTISTDSQKAFSSIYALIQQQIDNIDITSNKYIYFKCKEDFIEMLYTVAILTQTNGVDLDYTHKKENHFSITTGDITRKKRYSKTYHLNDNLFTYLK